MLKARETSWNDDNPTELCLGRNRHGKQRVSLLNFSGLFKQFFKSFMLTDEYIDRLTAVNNFRSLKHELAQTAQI